MLTGQAMNLAWLVATFSVSISAPGETPDSVAVPSLDVQVAAARLAAPEDRRSRAGVLAFAPDGRLVVARQGQNELICLADDPKKAGFQVACYHKDLEPYMARGRALKAAGVTGSENRQIRWKEIEAGKLPMPKTPTSLYVLSGLGYDQATGEVVEPYLRYVLYTPYATVESTGLTLSGSPSAPWLMFPGTPGAHIMINPPPKSSD